MNPRQIPLVDGPLKGQVHERYGAILPAEIGLKDPDGVLHWYALRNGKGYFVRTERKEAGK